MAAWHHVFGLLSVLCMCFGALYIVFNSDFNDVCDYSDTVESCSELKSYKNTDMAWENNQLATEFLRRAQDLRSKSEKLKCKLEQDLLMDLQARERNEANRIVTKCMSDFRRCVMMGYTTTKAPAGKADCTTCNRFCTSMDWANVNPTFAKEMEFSGKCSKTVCPWLPECGDGEFTHKKCSQRGCPCEKVACPLSAALPQGTQGPTTTATTTTYTGITTTATTTTGTTVTTTATTTTATTTTGTSLCTCNAGSAGTVHVGRPYKSFYSIPGAVNAQLVEYWQGVVIETKSNLSGGAKVTNNCASYFSNKTYYAGPRKSVDPVQARASHTDLGCGYTGTFDIVCGQTAAEKVQGKCSLTVDVSTCTPPTYSQALDYCYTVPPSTTPEPYTGPAVPDWLGVEELNFTLASLPEYFEITTQTTTPYPCCEVHVGSVCRPDINFMTPAKTINGEWQPKLSYKRQTGYFPVVPCDKQAKNVPRPCPRVKIKELNTAYLQWPQCLGTCSNAKVQAEFAQICNRTKHKAIDEKEQAAHKAKIDSMKEQAAELEAWVKNRMVSVTESKQVIDCFSDRLSLRYNGLALPKMMNGVESMPLHNQCRLHGCTVNQCLQVKRKCKVPFVHEAPEVMCNVFRKNGTFTCIDKIGMMSNSPQALQFGTIWFIVGGLFACGSLISVARSWDTGTKSTTGKHHGKAPPVDPAS